MQSAPATGEGGNYVDVRYGPLTQVWPVGSDVWDYHIADTSPAIDGPGAQPSIGADHDFDQQFRPAGARVDWGADEVWPAGTPPSPPTPQGLVAYSSGAFGEVPLETTAELTITATVSVADVTFFSSTNPTGSFAKTGDTCSGNLVVAGGNCTFTVTYAPTAVGVDSGGSLTIDSNEDGNPQTVSLSGTGVLQGVVEIGPASFGSLGGGTLDFEKLSNGNYSSVVTLSVGESTPVTFGTLVVSGDNFTMGSDSCSGETVLAGATCTVTVIFDAEGNNQKTGSLALPHNGVGPQTLDLRGQ
jgi:hypothetical protein